MRKSLIAFAALVLAVACTEFDPFTAGLTGTITGEGNWASNAGFTYFAGTQSQDFAIASGKGTKTATFTATGEPSTIEGVTGCVAVTPAFTLADASYDGSVAVVTATYAETQKIAALGEYPLGTMVAVGAANSKTLTFNPAGGYVAVKIAGDNVNITKVTIIANGKETINGTAEITVEGGAIADVEMLEDGTNTVALDCGEAGVTITKVAKDFYVFLPAGTYSDGLTTVITASDGAQNTIENTDPVTVNNGKVTRLAEVSFAPFVDLNATNPETANCYIITKGGSYYFNASVKGNGDKGIHKLFPDQSSTLAPVGAKVVWEEEAGLVTNPFIKDGKLYFSCSGKDGNALVAATDANDNIIWSWHIWSTLAPAEISVLDGKYVFMDRNLGAYSKEDCGFYYEFGRKDPFNGTNENTVCDPRHANAKEIITWVNDGDNKVADIWGIKVEEYNTIAFSIAHPDAYIGTTSKSDCYGQWGWLLASEYAKDYTMWLWGKSHYYYAQSDHSIDDGNGPYAAFKSIYDPCPAGYMVCTPTALADGCPLVDVGDGNMQPRATWTKNGASMYDGKLLIPHSGFLYNVGNFGWDTDMDGDGKYDWVGLMTCESGWGDRTSANFRLQCGDGDPRNVYGPAAAHPVRCMKAFFNGDTTQTK